MSILDTWWISLLDFTTRKLEKTAFQLYKIKVLVPKI